LLIAALALEGLPALHPIPWAIVLWLAIVNTAAGYALYNHSLRILTALEINMFLNLAPLVTALLAWLLLDETLIVIQITGIIVVISGVILVQLTGNRSKRK
jgi:drug/metabolite transporter (DMT)-like permease